MKLRLRTQVKLGDKEIERSMTVITKLTSSAVFTIEDKENEESLEIEVLPTLYPVEATGK